MLNKGLLFRILKSTLIFLKNAFQLVTIYRYCLAKIWRNLVFLILLAFWRISGGLQLLSSDWLIACTYQKTHSFLFAWMKYQYEQLRCYSEKQLRKKIRWILLGMRQPVFFRIWKSASHAPTYKYSRKTQDSFLILKHLRQSVSCHSRHVYYEYLDQTSRVSLT